MVQEANAGGRKATGNRAVRTRRLLALGAAPYGQQPRTNSIVASSSRSTESHAVV